MPNLCLTKISRLRCFFCALSFLYNPGEKGESRDGLMLLLSQHVREESAPDSTPELANSKLTADKSSCGPSSKRASHPPLARSSRSSGSSTSVGVRSGARILPSSVWIRSCAIPMLLLLIMIFCSRTGRWLSVSARGTAVLLLLLVIIRCSGLLWWVVPALLLLGRRALIWRLHVGLVRSASIRRRCTISTLLRALRIVLLRRVLALLLLGVGILWWVRLVFLRVVASRGTCLRSTAGGKATVVLLLLLLLWGWVEALLWGPRVGRGLRGTIVLVSRHCQRFTVGRLFYLAGGRGLRSLVPGRGLCWVIGRHRKVRGNCPSRQTNGFRRTKKARWGDRDFVPKGGDEWGEEEEEMGKDL